MLGLGLSAQIGLHMELHMEPHMELGMELHMELHMEIHVELHPPYGTPFAAEIPRHSLRDKLWTSQNAIFLSSQVNVKKSSFLLLCVRMPWSRPRNNTVFHFCTESSDASGDRKVLC